MKTPKQQFGFSQKILALSLLVAFVPAHAEEDEVAQLVQPDSYASIGWGHTDSDGSGRGIFGQYNGLRLDNNNLLLDVDIVKRDEALGLWTNFKGSNIGLDNGEMSFSQNKQGDWKYSVEYSGVVRRDPRTINTGLVFAGTTTPTVVSLAAPGTGRDIDLDIRRKAVSLSAEKWITNSLLFEASVKSENKEGARLSGIGLACANVIGSTLPCSTTTGAILMLPEPISYITKQFEAKLNYSGEKFLLSGGYYGSFFMNANGSLNPRVSGNLLNPDGTSFNPSAGTLPNTLMDYLQQPVALPPENQAHQLHVAGNYEISPTTRSTFKVAYTRATQNQDFGSMGFAGATAGNLEGEVDTSFAQVGLTSRPVAKLSVLANVRYEAKEDKTPVILYNGVYSNTPYSTKKLNGKLEGSYQLPDNYRATLGIDYDKIHRDRPVEISSMVDTPAVLPLSGMREDTNELGYRAELRRSMSETLNAAFSLIHSKREGNSWFGINTGFTPAPAAPYGAYPSTMMDRNRDKMKVSADWTPFETLSIQFMLENGKDKYDAPVSKGLRETGMSNYGIDAALRLSDDWKLTGYVNQGIQTQYVDHNAGYMAELENVNTSMELGAIGKISSKLEIGGNVSYMEDVNHYKQSMGTGAAIIGGGLPDVIYRTAKLKLFGKYALQKNADIRVELARQIIQFDEWAWNNNGVPFAYSDNTTVTMQPNQNVNFLGASFIYKFR